MDVMEIRSFSWTPKVPLKKVMKMFYNAPQVNINTFFGVAVI